MSTPNEPAFDWSQAASLLGDDPNAVEPDMAAIVKELVDGAKLQFEELKGKDPVAEPKVVSSLAHALRGCLLNFGFTQVGLILLEVEKATYPPGEYQNRLNAAEADFLTSKKLLMERYPSLGLA